LGRMPARIDAIHAKPGGVEKCWSAICSSLRTV
jgi:hypothetical protein